MPFLKPKQRVDSEYEEMNGFYIIAFPLQSNPDIGFENCIKTAYCEAPKGF